MSDVSQWLSCILGYVATRQLSLEPNKGLFDICGCNPQDLSTHFYVCKTGGVNL